MLDEDQVVYEDEFNVWLVCRCFDHVTLRPEGYEGYEHGSVNHCCDRPHSLPPGIIRMGKPSLLNAISTEGK